MEDRILGLIFIAIGTYFFLVATGVIQASRDPARMAKFLEKWGLLWAILSFLMVVGGFLMVFVL